MKRVIRTILLAIAFITSTAFAMIEEKATEMFDDVNYERNS